MTSFNCKADWEAVLCPGDKDVNLVSTQLSQPHTISNWKRATQHFALRNCYEPSWPGGIIHIPQALSAFLIVLMAVQMLPQRMLKQAGP